MPLLTEGGPAPSFFGARPGRRDHDARAVGTIALEGRFGNASPASTLSGHVGEPTMTSSSRRSGIKLNRPFVGIPSFLRAPIETNLEVLDADIAVYGVPFDEGSPFLAGSRMGPRSIREHSLRFAASRRRALRPRDAAHLPRPRVRQPDHRRRRRCRRVAHRREEHLRQRHRSDPHGPRQGGTAGGARRRPLRSPTRIVKGFEDEEPLHVIHFDAHIDYAPFIHDLRFTNGHAFRHIAPMQHVLSLTQVGIRSLRSFEAHIQDSIDDGNRVMTMGEFHDVGPRGVAEVVPARCTDLRQHRHRRARPAADPRVRVGRAERNELCGVARHPRRHRRALQRGRARPRRGEPDPGRGDRHHLLSRRAHGAGVPREHLPPAALGAAPAKHAPRRVADCGMRSGRQRRRRNVPSAVR